MKITPQRAEVKVVCQGLKNSFSINIHVLKNLCTKYEHGSSYGLWIMNLTYRMDARVDVDRCTDGSTSEWADRIEPPHDKINKMTVRPAKTQISLGIRPVWSESSLSAWRKLGSLATYWAHSKDSDQTGQMPRLIWVFAGRTVILLVLSWGGSNLDS